MFYIIQIYSKYVNKIVPVANLLNFINRHNGPDKFKPISLENYWFGFHIKFI